MAWTFVHVEGSQEAKPLEFDATTSNTVIYIRKNIERITKIDEMGGDSIELWSYDETTVPTEDFQTVVSAMISSINDTNKNQSTDIEDLGDAIIEMSAIVYS